MNEEPIALEAYNRLADAYAAKVDAPPHNAFYSCPAMLSMLPPVEGKRVLDAACGPRVPTPSNWPPVATKWPASISV